MQATPFDAPRLETWICAQCGKHCERPVTKGQRPKWCSLACADLAKKGASRICEQCGAAFFGHGLRFCSRSCGNAFRRQGRVCHDCGVAVTGKRQVCDACLSSRTSNPIREAVEAQAWGQAGNLLRAKCRIVDDCWEWQGQIKNGYPIMKFGSRRTIGVHRIAASVGVGRWIGDLHAHHSCANRRCVNPSHVIPASNIDNVIEMKARHGLLARIAELEDALYRVDPTNKALGILPILVA